MQPAGFDLLRLAGFYVAFSDRHLLGKGLSPPLRFTRSPGRWWLLVAASQPDCLHILCLKAFMPLQNNTCLPLSVSEMVVITWGRNLVPIHMNTEMSFGVSPGQLSSVQRLCAVFKLTSAKDLLVKCEIILVKAEQSH